MFNQCHRNECCSTFAHTFEICTKNNDTNTIPLFLISIKIKRKKNQWKCIQKPFQKYLQSKKWWYAIKKKTKWAAIWTRYWPTQEESISQVKKIQSHIRNSTGNQLFLGKNMLQKKSERFNIIVIVFVSFVWFYIYLSIYFFIYSFIFCFVFDV